VLMKRWKDTPQFIPIIKQCLFKILFFGPHFVGLAQKMNDAFIRSSKRFEIGHPFNECVQSKVIIKK
jgi:hypothetical protein